MQRGVEMEINDCDIIEIEEILLPHGCHFTQEGKEFLRCNESKEVLACPGSGKTTLLMAKLYLLSKSMPFDNNAGICVLSHTNVAVNEIKKRLGTAADKILDYPNFVGTIQSFIDKFVAFPYLTNFTDVTIQVVDDSDYAECLWNICKHNRKFSKLKWLIENNVKNSVKYNDYVAYIKNLYIDENYKLRIKNVTKCISGKDKPSTSQFIDIKGELLSAHGIIRYADAYALSSSAIKEYGKELKNLMASRFKYVFVDEYQDCDLLQSEVINTLFDTTILQKIGDIDQAIYNSFHADETPWNVSENTLTLPGSNRYNQKIADILIPLRTNKTPIVSLNNNCKIPPTLIVYSEDRIEDVIDVFYEEIKNNKLNKLTAKGVFKAIGMIKNGSGITIGSYWNKYKRDDINSNNVCLEDYINQLLFELRKGNLHNVDIIIRKMFCRICFICGYVEEKTNRSFTVNTIKEQLLSCNKIDYKNSILKLCNMKNYSFNEVKKFLLSLIEESFDSADIKTLNDFIEDSNQKSKISESNNIWQSRKCDDEINVEFNTVYKVKGETHTATLYLETETSSASDIKRVLLLVNNKKNENLKSIHEKSKKVIYVGLSRPSHLLCLAIQQKTYSNNENVFKNWKVIKLE